MTNDTNTQQESNGDVIVFIYIWETADSTMAWKNIEIIFKSKSIYLCQNKDQASYMRVSKKEFRDVNKNKALIPCDLYFLWPFGIFIVKISTCCSNAVAFTLYISWITLHISVFENVQYVTKAHHFWTIIIKRHRKKAKEYIPTLKPEWTPDPKDIATHSFQSRNKSVQATLFAQLCWPLSSST